MTQAGNSAKMDGMIRKYLKVSPATALEDATEIKALCTAEWRIVDLGIAVETEFGIELSADGALSLRTVGAWRRLVK